MLPGSYKSSCCKLLFIKTVFIFVCLLIFSSTYRMRRGSPATSTPCFHLTQLPESFHSLHPCPPPRLCPSPPPFPAAPAVSRRQSGLTPVTSLSTKWSVTIPLPPTTSPLPPSQTQSLSSAFRPRMTSPAPTTVPRTARGPGATGPPPQVPASTAARPAVTGPASRST